MSRTRVSLQHHNICPLSSKGITGNTRRRFYSYIALRVLENGSEIIGFIGLHIKSHLALCARRIIYRPREILR